MRRVFTNASRNFVGSAFDNRVRNARNVLLAAPYFTDGARILAAVQAGRSVRLIVGLNSATSPFELEKLHHLPGLSIRFLTSRFHAKIFIFDDIAMVGSSNLTDGGMMSNREAVVCLDRVEDSDAIDEVKQLFRDLWESAAVLTDEKLAAFKSSWTMVRRKYGDADAEIEAAVGKNQPANISVDSRSPSRERIFLEDLRQLVYEQYRPAFSEVEGILVANHFRRPELAGAGLANETNRFLNWLRLTRVAGDDAWRDAPLRAPEQRRAIVIEAGQASAGCGAVTGSRRLSRLAWQSRCCFRIGGAHRWPFTRRDRRWAYRPPRFRRTTPIHEGRSIEFAHGVLDRERRRRSTGAQNACSSAIRGRRLHRASARRTLLAPIQAWPVRTVLRARAFRDGSPGTLPTYERTHGQSASLHRIRCSRWVSPAFSQT